MSSGWKTFNMAPPDRDTYTSRVNKYLMDVPLPADILMIIAEYASTLVFFMGDIMAQLLCVIPPRPLPLLCPKEFVDHNIRTLATIRIFGEYYDQLSNCTWRKRFDTVEFWEPYISDIRYRYKLSQYPEDGCYSVLDEHHPGQMPKIMHIYDCEDTYLIEKLKFHLDVF